MDRKGRFPLSSSTPRLVFPPAIRCRDPSAIAPPQGHPRKSPRVWGSPACGRLKGLSMRTLASWQRRKLPLHRLTSPAPLAPCRTKPARPDWRPSTQKSQRPGFLRNEVFGGDRGKSSSRPHEAKEPTRRGSGPSADSPARRLCHRFFSRKHGQRLFSCRTPPLSKNSNASLPAWLIPQPR